MQRWPRRILPTDLSPIGTRCIQIIIPDDDDWERAMYAEVATLSQWMRWERDLGKNGKPVADIWLKALETWSHCDGSPSPIQGMEVDDMPLLRVDCDCNVFITCCDGTEKQLLTKDQIDALLRSQPGAGSPTPQPGGGTAQNCGAMSNGGTWTLPHAVNSGDVLTMSGLNGAWKDKRELFWHCPDGWLFWDGSCVQDLNFNGADPLPSVLHMSIIAEIDGTFYDIIGIDGSGNPTPFTVPGGHTNAQLTLQANIDDLTQVDGTVNFCVTAQNNQVVSWSHTFDFRNAPNPFHPLSDSLVTDAAVWTPGIGWVATDQTLPGGSHERVVGIQLDPIAFAMDSIDFVFSRSVGTLDNTTASGQNLVLNTSVVDSVTWGALVSGSPLHYGWNTPTAITSRIAVILGCANNNTGPTFDGSAIIQQCTVRGHGPDPFAV